MVGDPVTTKNKAFGPRGRFYTSFFSTAVAAVLVNPLPLLAQDTLSVSGQVMCGECSITWDTIATIGGLDGPGLGPVMRYSSVAVDHRGRIFIGVYRVPEISVFDSAGTFLRAIGRSGEGPGEYQFVSHITADRRYIHVFDMRGKTMLDYDFEVVRSDRFPRQFSHSYAMGSGDIAFAGDLPLPASAGHRFHIVRGNGTVESFGGEAVVYRGPSFNSSVIAGDSETAWVVEPRPNRITRWDLAPKPTVGKVFVRRVEEYDRHNPNLFPRSRNHGVMVDENGLWVLWEAPDPDFDERGEAGSEEPDLPRGQMVDSYLDLLDPLTGQTLVRAHFDGGMAGFAKGLGSRYLVAYQETPAGVVYLHLLDPSVSGGNRDRTRTHR